MNLFRSEEHVMNWPRFEAAAKEGIVPLTALVGLFSLDLFKKRLEPDYATRSPDYAGEFLSAVAELGKERPFWRM